MSEQRCGTCKHWAQTGSYPSSYGGCKAVFAFWPPDPDDPAAYNELIRLARVACVLGYEVDDFCTRAEFGCVMWEPKQAPEAIQ